MWFEETQQGCGVFPAEARERAWAEAEKAALIGSRHQVEGPTGGADCSLGRREPDGVREMAGVPESAEEVENTPKTEGRNPRMGVRNRMMADDTHRRA